MSDDFTENEDVAWEDVALRRIFLECLASSSSTSSLSSLPSTTSEVCVSTLVNYIRDNASDNYRDEALLDELQAAIEEVTSDGQVNWTLFKKASRRWVDKVRRNQWQDGNNNIAKNNSNDDLLERSDDEKGNTEVVSGSSQEFDSLADRCRKPKTPRRFVTADFVNLSNVSSYSPSSDTTHGCAMSTDTTPESADYTDVGSGSCCDVAQVDLRLRVRRFDEENALLREELVRAEELSAGFQGQFENLRRKLDRVNEKCRLLERENDEYKEILHDVEKKERDYRWAQQKTEKECASLARKLEEAEAERQRITNLTLKLETCKREKLDCMKEAVVCRQEVEEKQIECEMLREKLAQIVDTNDSLQESHEKTIRHLREQNQELKNQIFDLQSKQSAGSLSDICSTPPTSYLHSYTQSSPYSNNQSVQLHDSLYAELKASGFSIEDTANASRVRDLEEELSWYNEEIRDAVKQIDDILKQLNRQRPAMPHVPDLPLDVSTIVKTADIYELLQKISKLSNAVNGVICRPKVKDASVHVCVASTAYTKQRICSQYGIMNFEDCLRLASENRGSETDGIGKAIERRESGFFLNTFSMNSRLLGEYAEEVEVASKEEDYRETDAQSPSRKRSMTAPLGIQEHTIIDPIVEELDRILQCTNQCEEQLFVQPSNCSPSKNSKFKCIYTCAQPTSDPPVTDVNYSVTDSTLNSPKLLERDLAATYVISSGGDGPPLGIVNNNSITKGDSTVDEDDSMLKIIRCDDSNTVDVDSLSEFVLKTQNLKITEFNESETLPEESIDKLQNSKSSSENLSSPSSFSTPAAPSTPWKINDLLVAEKKCLPNANGIAYHVTPNKILRKLPRRKISVFHRSFDVDTLHAVGEAGGSDTYRLTERSMSTPDAKQDNQVDDEMELDLDCMQKTPNIRTHLLNTYRTNANDSDSSESTSPEKSLGYCREVDTSTPKVQTRASTRPIVLAPKLKIPSWNDVACITSIEKEPTKSSNADDKNEEKGLPETKGNDKCDMDLTANETHKTYDVWKVDKCKTDLNEISQISEMIRPGDEVDRGITYRRGSTARESDFSSYSLLSPTENSIDDNLRDPKLESMSTVVPSSDGESTSCDSSPKREPPLVQASHPLSSTYVKLKTGEQSYVRQDLSQIHGMRLVDRLIEGGIGGGNQAQNDGISIRTVASYGGGGGGGGIRAPDEKASVVPAVALAMSSGEESSDSECDPMAIQGDEDRRNVVSETRSISPAVLSFVNGAFLGSSTPAPAPTVKNDSPDERGDSGPRKPVAQKRDKRERVHTIRRSLSESGCGRSESSCHCTTGNSISTEFNKEETRPNAFPSLTDTRLQESGIANLSSSDELGGSLSEADIERKYTAFSVGLVTDRVTLPRRMALSIRQRDQSERNLACEIQKMHQDIQDLAPLCIDRESLERVERIRHQLEMITQCAHRVSCTAETLGAVHQEFRISRAVLLADKYLLVLRSRCEKLASDLAETKRILTENNIVVEEHNGELGDDLPRIRYRGMPTNNRTMMARRRASIATIFRPLGNFQDVTKDGVRQRNSVSGRVTLRRPSLSAESQKWEADKLDRTDSSSSSIGELREIFEQAESRRTSREENNNVSRLHSSNLSIRDCENGEGDVWGSTREEPIVELPHTVDGCQESRLGRTTPQLWTMHTNVPWKPMLWCIVISFFFGFYMKHVVSSVNECSGTPLRWWSIEEILGRNVNIKNDAPRPI